MIPSASPSSRTPKLGKKIAKPVLPLRKSTLRTRLKDKAEHRIGVIEDHHVQVQKKINFLDNLNRQQLICSICLELFLFPFQLRCGHIFCFMCLDKLSHYGQMGGSCPCCRSVIGEQYPSRCRSGQLLMSVVVNSHLTGSQRNYYLNRGSKALQQLQLRQLQLKNIKVSQKIDFKVGNTWRMGKVIKIHAVDNKSKIEVACRESQNIFVFAKTSSHLAAFGTFTSERIQEVEDFLDIFMANDPLNFDEESDSANLSTQRRVIDESESVDFESANQMNPTFTVRRLSSTQTRTSTSGLVHDPVVIYL